MPEDCSAPPWPLGWESGSASCSPQWSILAARKPRGMSLDQHIAKLTEWDRQTGERLINALGLPPDLHDDPITAVNTRNLFAHRFLRERTVFFGDPRASNDAARVLAE